jgi:hypothetical protein
MAIFLVIVEQDYEFIVTIKTKSMLSHPLWKLAGQEIA